jgi:hypothetical protein
VEFNAAGTAVFRSLVQSSPAERTPNGYRLRPGRPIDPDEQFARAVEAFGRNGFVALARDRQVLSLDEEIDLAGDAPTASSATTPPAPPVTENPAAGL